MALDLNDKTSNGNTLTTNNAVGEFISSFPFVACTEVAEFTAASNSYLKRADTASLSITGDFTFELWARFKTLPSSGGAMTLIAKFDDSVSAKYDYIWQLRDFGGVPQSWLNYSNLGNNPVPVGVNWTPTTNTFYHMAITFLASTKKINFYIDGSLQGTEQTGAYTSIKDDNNDFVLGAWNPSQATANDLLNGELTEIRIWNVVRTPTEINTNKALHLAGNESGLVAYWPFQSLASATNNFALLGVG